MELVISFRGVGWGEVDGKHLKNYCVVESNGTKFVPLRILLYLYKSGAPIGLQNGLNLRRVCDDAC
jgi:hypothetical protein